MCNPKPSSPSSFVSNEKVHFVNSNKPIDVQVDEEEQLHKWPTPSEAFEEMKEIGKIAGPTAITGLVLYSRSMISMLFLGYLGELELAGGSLSIGFANITGYSVISGLAMGMEPICGQAYGAKQMKLLGITLQRTDSWVAPSMDCVRGWSSLLALAIPTCVSVCLEWWWYEFMILLCGLLANPKATIASMGILIQTTSLVYVFPSSLSLGVSTRVGNELGANRPGRARISMIVSLFCAMALGLGAMLFTTLMRHKWGGFFTKDVEILKLTSIALPIVGLCELGNCPQTTGCGVLRGSARPTIGANINLGSFYFVGMPVAILVGFLLKKGFGGLWIGLLAAQASCAILMLYVLCKTDWKVQVERSKQLTQSTSTSLPVTMPNLDKKKKKKKSNNNNNNSNNLQEILCNKEEDDLMKSAAASLDTVPLIPSTT
ncbi:hypothetical protein KY290_022472 [Solanum tuberosum]|uniref:Multidrug and toxic compound extrusion protein n=1 Tax=Solanum tuberosum TaxID=4113 RepID=A0ABQ7V629_SOLTU|nr:hypothetical protein KY290_022472 [Solanum tuberosum]